MRKIILILTILFFTTCKSKEKIVQIDTKDSTSISKNNIEIKGLITKFNEFDLTTNEYEFTKYEPIYYKKNGKDTVELKPVTIKKKKIQENKKEVINIDTTSTKSEVQEMTVSTDNTNTESKYEGFDVIKSIVTGVVTFFVGPFKLVLVALGILLLIPLYRLIKRLLTKENKEEIKK
jgi:hypothetical protein